MTLSQPHHFTGIKCVRSTPVPETNGPAPDFDFRKERIKKLFENVHLSASSYDTAWVAMVPSPDSSMNPCFPRCIDWLLKNQHHDGSWGLPDRPSWLVKDSLSSTLACVLALKQWSLGEEEMNKGIKFIESNFNSITDEEQFTPVGFNIIFPGMIEYAKDLNLNLPLKYNDIDSLLELRHSELERSYREGNKEYLAYVSEGMGLLQDWEMVMKYQRKNGSLFNSPSATAASLMHLQNDASLMHLQSDRCLHYLCTLLDKFGDSVPTIYPLNLNIHLNMVEILKSLGIDRHFQNEINSTLNETYRLWLQNDEEIFLDPATCALAFRVLRVHGYDVSSEHLTQFGGENQSFNSFKGNLKDISAVLELFKTSQLMIHPEELVFKEQQLWTSRFLKQELNEGSFYSDRHSKYVRRQVEDTLKFSFHGSLERLAHRNNMKHYGWDGIRVLKTSYRSSNIGNEDYQEMAIADYNFCQAFQREELKQLERWISDKRLDTLKFARQKVGYCYFSAAANLFPPELSDARIAWAKNGVLTTVVDDFFDVGGSEEELFNLIHLLEKCNAEEDAKCCSEQVKIIYLALHDTIHEIAERAFQRQGRDVTSHVVEIWLDLMMSMLKETKWTRNNAIPSVDDYMTNAYVSFALGPIVLPTIYLVGPQLSEEVARSSEMHKLFKHMSTSGRLLNDIQGFKRESAEGKLNAVSLHMIHNNVTEDEAILTLKAHIDAERRELLRSILQGNGSTVPRKCKDLFWNMTKVLNLFYSKDDGFTSDGLVTAVKEMIYHPMSIEELM